MLVNHITWSGGSQNKPPASDIRLKHGLGLNFLDLHGGLDGPPIPRRSAAPRQSRGAPRRYAATSASAAARAASSMSVSVCASETKAASNCEGASEMPRSSMAWKKRA
jgi:hypothetical protein